MGVDTEKEMDMVTRKVERVFKVILLVSFLLVNKYICIIGFPL